MTKAKAMSSASRTPGVPAKAGTSRRGDLESIALGRGSTGRRAVVWFQGLTLAHDQLRLLTRSAGRDRIAIAIAPLTEAKLAILPGPLGRRY